MINKFEIRDKEDDYLLVAVRYDSEIPDYPLEIKMESDLLDGNGTVTKDLSIEEGLELFNKLRNIFEPCLKNI